MSKDPKVIYEAPDQPKPSRDPIFDVAALAIDTFNNPLPGEDSTAQVLRFIHRLSHRMSPPKTKA